MSDSCRESKGASVTEFSDGAFYLVVVGAFFDVAAVFLPWAATASVYYYLPWTSPRLFVPAIFLEGTVFVFASISIRGAAILGWTGIVLQELVKKVSMIHRIFILSSVILSFFTVCSFAVENYLFYWGFHVAVFGFVCKLVGFLVDVLKVEVILEEEETKLSSD